MAREAIGTIICPMCGDLAEVRQDKNGKLYYSGEAGLITPRLTAGQNWIRDNMVGNDFKKMASASNEKIDTELDEHEPTVREKSTFERLMDSAFGGDDE